MGPSDAKQLIVEARNLGVELWIEGSRLRFRAPPTALSDQLRDALRNRKAEIIAQLRSEAMARQEIGPLAANQRGLWFLYQLVPTSPAYNLAFTLRIRGNVEVSVLEESLQILLDRNESLRASYPLLDGIPQRQVTGYVEVALEIVDARAWSAAELRSRVQTDYAQPFDLQHGPVFRARLYREASGDSLLLLGTHHIVADGTALFVLLEEMFALYEALAGNGSMPIAKGGASFGDFVTWQTKTLAHAQADLSYWSAALTPPPAPLNLPTDRPRSPEIAMRGRSLHRILPAPLAASVRALAKSESTTDYVILLSLWFVLLHRNSGNDDITVGTPVLGRPSGQFARTIGDFVNLLPLRVRSMAALSFNKLVQEVRRVVLEGMARQDIPLPQMLENAGHRQPGGRPPFQSVFILQNFSHFQHFERLMLGREEERFSFGSLTVSPYRIDQQEGQFELAVDIWQQEEELYCSCRYDSDLYDEKTIAALMGRYETLIRAAVSAPETPVARLSLMDPVERQRVLAEFNATDQEYPRGERVVSLFEAQAQRRPQAVAVRHAAQSLTYGQLAARSRQFARHLQTLGVGPATLVGLCVDRDCDLLVAVLGILQTGAAYVPLDPGFPPERLAYMLDDCGSAVLVTTTALGQRLFPSSAARRVYLDAEASAINQQSSAALPSLARPENRAYVLYTSGSTGRPKGVEIEHRALTNFLVSMAREPGLGETDVLLAVTTLSFDIAGLELFLPLITGACIELVARDTALDGGALARLITTSGATVLQATPATWRLLFESGWSGVSTLKALCGGEAMGRDLALRLLPAVGEVWNMYGPTETTIWSSLARITSADDISIGRPIANTQLYVLDAQLEPVPPGVTGELWIGGEGVARGYLNRAELTAERFIANPFHSGRMYRTGDLARYRSDGSLVCLGRIDAQVKVRGFRIELGEIESALGQLPGIIECAVIAQTLNDDTRLIAYLVGEVSAEVCRQHLQSRLPDYMVPSAFIALPVLPKTPNQKIDRNALPRPDAAAISASQEYVPPDTETEKTVAQIFEDILATKPVGLDHNFFHLGGHSLLATRVVSRLRQHFGITPPLRTLFDNPTVRGLSKWIDHSLEQIGSSAPSLPAPVAIVSREGKLPLSFTQQRLWFLHQFEPESPEYNMPVPLRLRGKLDAQALRQTLIALIARHETLRTTFIATDGEPAIMISSSGSVSPVLEFTTLSGDTHAERQKAGLGWLRSVARRPMNLQHGPLFVTAVAQLEPDEHLLVFLLHHSIGDGWSLGVLLKEWAELYTAAVEQLPLTLPPLPFQYVDFFHWQLQQSALPNSVNGRPGSKTHLQYWAQQLTGCPPVSTIPPTKDRPATLSHQGAAHPIRLTADVAASIKDFARQQNVSVFMVLLSGLMVLLRRHSGQSDLVIGTPVAGRQLTQSEMLIGPFLNMLPIRARLEEAPTFAMLVQQMREHVLESFVHQNTPFEQIVEVVHAPRIQNVHPLFQVMFAYQNFPIPKIKLPALEVESMPFDRGVAQFDLNLYLYEEQECITGALEYSTDLYDEKTIAALMGRYETLIRAAVSAPETPVARLSLMDPVERQRVLAEFNATDQEYPRGERVVSLFEAQAQRRPQAVAVRHAAQSLTYGQLAARSRQFARHLQTLGVGPATLVGLCVDRDCDLLVAVLGILQTGAAYVPLDPGFPPERLAYMLDDCGSAVLVTTTALGQRLFPSSAARRVYLDAEASAINQQSSAALPALARPENRAYVLYTSGSTGRPKGVEIEHRALTNFLVSMAREPGLVETDVLLAVTTLSFDIAGLELFLPLITGACIELVARDTALDGGALARLIATSGATVLQATPATWRLLFESGWSGVSTLKALCGGEAMGRDLALRLLPAVKEVWNMYGPTETTIWSSLARITSADDISIGRPIANTQLYVLDTQLEPVPPGVTGELWIGGEGVARGYLHRAELTAERFIANPFHSGRMYRTGDLARYRSDGSLVCLGRIDAQVKVRGFRIELGEIESALGQLPGIIECAVIAQTLNDDTRLIAYVVGDASAEVCRQHLQSRLPDYMVPSAFIALTVLPKTPNQKIDRNALPRPDAAAISASREYVPPDTETEKTVAQIFEDILATKPVGLDHNFFHLGGHSLLATRVVSRLRQHFGITPPLRTLFDNPTVRGLSKWIDMILWTSQPGDALSPDRISIEI